jgi:hypothetical protein
MHLSGEREIRMDDQSLKEYPGEEQFYNSQKLQPARPFWRRYLWQIVASVALILVIILASTTIVLLTRPSQSSTTNVHATPVSAQPPTQIATTGAPTTSTSNGTATGVPAAATPTSQVTSGLPCNVDITTWKGGSPDWVVHNGILFNDGSNGSYNGPTIIAPCQPGVTNYAVQARIQVTSQNGNCFGLVFRGSSTQNGWQGYRADICGNTADISSYEDGNALTQAPFTPGATAHTYRAEVKDNTLKFFIDGNLVDTTTDNRLLTKETGEGVGLYSQYVQLQVTSFQVMALS